MTSLSSSAYFFASSGFKVVASFVAPEADAGAVLASSGGFPSVSAAVCGGSAF